MMIEQDILRRTNNGLSIYRIVLQHFYPGENTVHLTGSEADLSKNPFNNHRKTLRITKEEDSYRYSDIEIPDFMGDPFDFAALHYTIEGIQLYKLLNFVLNLNLDERHFIDHAVDSPKPIPVKTPIVKTAMPLFSFFKAPIKNVTPFKNMTLLEAYKLIGSNSYFARTCQLRAMASGQEARAFKSSRFDYATFSGIFSNRRDNALSKHSGLMTIDFDHIPDVQKLKQQLLSDVFVTTELLFVSPSGNGIKWIISMGNAEIKHSDFFKAVSKYIRDTYQLEIDQSGRDVSRACYLPCDPEVYINPKYLQL